MTVQTLKFGNREFVVIPKRDFQILSARAERQAEDEYWTQSALRAEAKARARGGRTIPLEEIERELDRRNAARRRSSRRNRR